MLTAGGGVQRGHGLKKAGLLFCYCFVLICVPSPAFECSMAAGDKIIENKGNNFVIGGSENVEYIFQPCVM